MRYWCQPSQAATDLAQPADSLVKKHALSGKASVSIGKVFPRPGNLQCCAGGSGKARKVRQGWP
jgi:hypothetical protein